MEILSKLRATQKILFILRPRWAFGSNILRRMENTKRHTISQHLDGWCSLVWMPCWTLRKFQGKLQCTMEGVLWVGVKWGIVIPSLYSKHWMIEKVTDLGLFIRLRGHLWVGRIHLFKGLGVNFRQSLPFGPTCRFKLPGAYYFASWFFWTSWLEVTFDRYMPLCAILRSCNTGTFWAGRLFFPVLLLWPFRWNPLVDGIIFRWLNVFSRLQTVR